MAEQQAIDLNIGNICEGALPELFDTEIRKVLENIADVNTEADAIRGVTITLRFKPAPDRRSAVVVAQATSKLCGVAPTAGSIFFAKRQGALLAYAEDPRQDRLFAKEPVATPSKQ